MPKYLVSRENNRDFLDREVAKYYRAIVTVRAQIYTYNSGVTSADLVHR